MPSPASETERRYWDKQAGRYEPLAESAYNVIWGSLPPFPPSGRFLEIGCGSGAFGRRLVSRSKRLRWFGIDIAPKFLPYFPGTGVAGDGVRLPFRSEVVDLVAFPASLHHMHPWRVALDEAYRVIKRGGAMLLYEPNLLHPHRRLARIPFLHPLLFRATDNPLNPNEVRNHLWGGGARNIRVRYVSLAPATPGILGRCQSLLDRLPRPGAFEPLLRPWFLLRAEKP